MEVTELLREVSSGDEGAMDRLAALLYPELKAMARRRSHDVAGIGATTLVSETFLRLLSGGKVHSDDRRQFFGLAATVMRRIIIDEIRYATAGKRAGKEVTLVETMMGSDAHEQAEFLLQVDELLSLVKAEDERTARVFECRYFAGLTTAETADCLGLSERSVERAWSAARKRLASLIDGN